ncbi:MAG: hypothetical protein ACQESO_00155 [Bacillota bacterium]
MSKKSNLKLYDDLIRKAVAMEIDCIEVEQAGKAWQNIESKLEQSRPSYRPRFLGFTWGRAAAVAAACLVLVAGGLGIFRTAQHSVPLADSEMPAEQADEIGVLRVEDDVDLTETTEKEAGRGEHDLQVFLGVPDPMPPAWPQSLPGDYMLDEEIIFIEAGEPEYRGAIYFSSNTALLLVKSEVHGQGIPEFLDHLGDHIKAELGDIDLLNRYTYISVEEHPGLAWQDNGGSQALLVLFGDIDIEELKRIAAFLD